MAVVGLRNLCAPARVYLVLSLSLLFMMFFQNIGQENKYCLGEYSCDVSSNWFIFVIKILYIIFWTWILNLMCNADASGFAWFLVLFPIILFFILIGLLMTK